MLTYFHIIILLNREFSINWLLNALSCHTSTNIFAALTCEILISEIKLEQSCYFL